MRLWTFLWVILWSLTLAQLIHLFFESSPSPDPLIGPRSYVSGPTLRVLVTVQLLLHVFMLMIPWFKARLSMDNLHLHQWMFTCVSNTLLVILILDLFLLSPTNGSMVLLGGVSFALHWLAGYVYLIHVHFPEKQRKDMSSSFASSSTATFHWFWAQQKRWTWIAVLLLVFFFLHHLDAWFQLVGQVPGIFTSSQLQRMNNHSLIPSTESFRAHRPLLQTLPESSPRAILVVVDGLGYDALVSHPLWSSFLEDLPPGTFEFQSSLAQVPTMSIPNWITLLSGANSDVTGVQGNLFLQDISLDTLFHRVTVFDPLLSWPNSENYASSAKMNRTLIGSSWFEMVVAGQDCPVLSTPTEWYEPLRYMPDLETPFLAQNLSFPLDHTHGHLSDIRRTHMALDLLREQSFLLLHLESVDHMGHHHGATSHEYRNCIELALHLVRRILATVGNDTLVIFTADHGHVAPGGHGGATPELTHVPLLLFHGLGTVRQTQTAAARAAAGMSMALQQAYATLPLPSDQVHTRDVAESLAWWLEIQTPRQSQGTLWAPLLARMHPRFWQNQTWRILMWLDRYHQRRTLLLAAQVQSGQESRYLESFQERFPLMEKLQVSDVNDVTELWLLTQWMTLSDEEESAWQRDLLIWQTCRSLLCGWSICGFVGACYVFLARKWSLMTPRDLMLRARRKVCCMLGIYLLITCLVYYLVMVAILQYPSWDSTHIHSPIVWGRFVAVTLVPGIVTFLILIRWAFMPFLTSASNGRDGEIHMVWALLHMVFQTGFHTRNNHVVSWREVIMYRTWLLHASVSVMLVLWMLESVYHSLFPWFGWVTTGHSLFWTMQFRVLSVGWMMFPWLIGTVWEWYSIPIYLDEKCKNVQSLIHEIRAPQ